MKLFSKKNKEQEAAAPADEAMADVAPAPVTTESAPADPAAPEDEVVASSSSPPTTTDDPNNTDSEPIDADMEDANQDQDEEGDDDEEEEEEHVKEWDEGGKSHCGYGDSVHETLMSIGQTIHKVVGEPNETVHNAMDTVGNWFQEASYAVRDLQRGKMNVGEEATAALKSVVTSEDKEGGEDGLENENGEGTADKGEGEGGGEEEELEKLDTVQEDVAKEEAVSP